MRNARELETGREGMTEWIMDNNQLSQMTLEELWHLFPIFLSEHKAYWSNWYREERNRIRTFLPVQGLRLSHIGSTAVPGIWAKPIIDILAEIPETESMEQVKDVLIKNGYVCMSESQRRKSFNRGYTGEGFAERVFHLHLRYMNDNDEVFFRDYLNDNPDAAEEYEALKLELWKKYEHNRDAYTEAKSEFVRKYTEKAKAIYGRTNHEGCCL